MNVLFRPGSFWIGCHYSRTLDKYCLNIIPCITITWTNKKGTYLRDKVEPYFDIITKISENYEEEKIYDSCN